MSGNRTRGVCVTGRNVTNYTNTDLCKVIRLKDCLHFLLTTSTGSTYDTKTSVPSFDHTTMDIPHPIRTAKSSIVGPNQYCGGGPRGNLGCRMFFFFSKRFPLFSVFLALFWAKTVCNDVMVKMLCVSARPLCQVP